MQKETQTAAQLRAFIPDVTGWGILQENPLLKEDGQ